MIERPSLGYTRPIPARVATRAESTRLEIRVVRRSDPDYPAAALALSDPPAALYVRGRWPITAPAVAIVGSRAATPYGLEMAARLAAGLARLGVVVVSGLAHGIDAAAHGAALEAGGATVAILPGGHDAIVPRGHQGLAHAIAHHGAVLSEYEQGAPLHRGAFLHRNRLIAALARAVVVVEAKERSGALNTASHARRLGRPLLAVPGDVDRPTSRGCHQLLRTGARFCEAVADLVAVLEESGGALGPPESRPATAAANIPLAGRGSADAGGEPVHEPLAPPVAAAGATPAQRLLAALAESPGTPETCARRCGLPLDQTMEALLELEWAGLAEAGAGSRWRRRGVAR